MEAVQQILPYRLVIHAYSNLSLQVQLGQTGFEPGATIHLQASLAQSGIHFSTGVQVWAEVKSPDGNATNLDLTVQGESQFAATFQANLPGVFQIRIRARGTTFTGEPFTREKTLTAAVWRGGDKNGDSNNGQIIIDYLSSRDARLCELINCFLKGGPISGQLEKTVQSLGLDLDDVRRCLSVFCKDRC
jgi:hypothetical protein